MSSAETFVSIIVWLNDDREILTDFLDEMESILRANYRYFEIVFVDNHSLDNSVDIISRAMQERPGLRLLRLSRPSTFEIGCAAGLDHAIGDYVILIDPYLDRPEDVPRLVAAAAEGFDVVIGERTNSILLRRSRRLVFALVSRILDEKIDPNQSYFRLFSRRVVTSLSKIKHRRRHLRYLNALVGYRQRTIPTLAHARAAQRPGGRSFLSSALIAIDLVISHSATPLRWAAVLGVLAGAGNLAWLLYVLVVAMFKKTAEGWLTMSVMIGSMFFVLFVILTILAEYVARILEEVQERPLYFIELEAESAVTTRREESRLNVV